MISVKVVAYNLYPSHKKIHVNFKRLEVHLFNFFKKNKDEEVLKD
jgi:hypothetical protein